VRRSHHDGRVLAVPADLSPASLRPFFRELYRDAPLVHRLRAMGRPVICPFEPFISVVPRGARTLDIGCGAGGILLVLAATGRIGEGIGCDVSEAAIRAAMAAQRRLPAMGVSFHRVEAIDDVPCGPFDAVLMIDTLHHIPPKQQRQAVLAAVQRVAPGGVLIYKDMMSRPARRRVANTLHDFLVAGEIVNYRSIAELETWVKDAGLSLVHAHSYARLVYGHDLRVFRRPT